MDEEMIKAIIISIFGGSSLGAIALYLVQKKFNKKKEDVELAVQMQDFYRKEIKHREDDKAEQREEIRRLEEKISKMGAQLDIMLEENKLIKEEIEDKHRNNLLYEEDNMKLNIIIKEKDRVIASQYDEIDKLSKTK